MKLKVKKLFLSIAIVLCAIFAVFGVTFTAQMVEADTHINLDNADVDGFTPPEIGELPDTEVHPVHFCYTVTEVIWMYKTGNYFSEWNVKKPFEQGTTYRVGIVVTADEGYYYKEGIAHNVAINGEPADYKIIDEEVVLITKDFTLDYYLKTVNVSGLNPPVAGQLPDTEVDCAHGSYTARVEWYNRTTHTVHSSDQPFKANTSYTAEIYITAKEGYIFDVTSASVQCFVNGASSSLVPSDKKENMTAIHYEVGYAPVQDVKIELDAPKPGATPDFEAISSGDGFVKDYTGDGYIKGIRWVDRYAGIILGEDDTFAADREYMLTIYVEADENHEFTSARKYVYVNDKMCNEQPSTDSRVRIFEIYIRTPKEIASVNVTNLLKPMDGNTPDYWLDVDAEGVSIESVHWEVYNDNTESLELMGESEKFADGKTYLLCVYLKNNNLDKVFATKTNSAGERIIATSTTLEGERVSPDIWVQEDGTRDPYNYMWFYCWYDCESEQVTQADVRITDPIAGEKPSNKVTVIGEQLTLYSVYWSKYVEDASGTSSLQKLDSNAVFEKGETYCAFITLQVVGNRKIPYNSQTGGCGVYGTVNGLRADTYAVKKLDDGTEADPYKYVKLTYWFDCNGEIINKVIISDIVAPVAGEYPCYDRTVIGSGYTASGDYAPTWDIATGADIYAQRNGVMWFDVTGGAYDYVYENQTFIGGHTYRLRVSLQTSGESRFAIDGDRNSTVTALINDMSADVEPSSISNQELYLYLFYEFTCEKVAIESIEVQIEAPVIGERPSWSKIDTKYFYGNMSGDGGALLNGILWRVYGSEQYFLPDGDEVFEENTEYSVYMYITLKEGYLIEDEDAFEVYLNGYGVYDAVIFPSEPASIMLLYVFPKTDCSCVIVPVAEQPATCFVNGMKAHYACEKCGTMYRDANGEQLLDENEEDYILWATDHEFGNWTDHEEYINYHVGTCKNCGETVEEACEFVAQYIEGPSKYSKYDGTLFVCERCGNEGAFYVDETSCEHILGNWQENGRMGGRHYRTCECGKAYEEEDCEYAITIQRAPSEYSEMHDVYLYTCKKCGSEIYTPIEGEIITEESVTDEQTNVTVSVPEGSATVLPEGTTVTASPVNTSNISEEAKQMMEESLNGQVDIYSGYDIVLYYNEVEIQPHAAVKVIIPIGEGVEQSDDLTILYYDDFSIVEIPTVVFDWTTGTVTFETDHFSKYLLAKVQKNAQPQEVLYCYFPGEANGSACSEYVIAGTEITLEECTFVALEGRRFKAWAIGSIDGEQKQPGEKIVINEETYIYAIWEDIPAEPDSSNPDNSNNPVTSEKPETPEKPKKEGCFGSLGSGSALVLGICGLALVWFVVKKKERM